ncbi:MAG TPA: DUF456 domain-containing protein [Humisphaera sp.]
MEWLYYGILVLFLLAGLGLTVVTLPGNWLALVATVAYAWVTGWRHVGWVWLVVLLVLATIGEIVELLAAGRAVKKVGGSRWGSFGALLGAVLGGLFLTFLVPVPVLGTIVGILVGTFLGAALGETVARKNRAHVMVIAASATKGRLYGTLLKLVIGIVMSLLILFAALPV